MTSTDFKLRKERPIYLYLDSDGSVYIVLKSEYLKILGWNFRKRIICDNIKGILPR